MISASNRSLASVKRAYWVYRNTGALAAAMDLLPASRVGDGLWLLLNYRDSFNRFPNILHPRQFNEHLIRLMISPDGRSELRRMISDKECVKEYVMKRLGDGLTARTLAILRTREDVFDYCFPATCVIKATHASGKTIVRINKSPMVDLHRICSWLDVDYSDILREPNYRQLEPKIIVEEYLSEDGKNVPSDYKIFCFHGRPAFIQVDTNRFTGHQRNYFSPGWRELNFEVQYPRSEVPISRPSQIDQMLDAAAILAVDFTFIRVDFYQLHGSFYVGELTNFPEAALGRFIPESAGFQAGRLFSEPTLNVESIFGVRTDSINPEAATLK